MRSVSWSSCLSLTISFISKSNSSPIKSTVFPTAPTLPPHLDASSSVMISSNLLRCEVEDDGGADSVALTSTLFRYFVSESYKFALKCYNWVYKWNIPTARSFRVFKAAVNALFFYTFLHRRIFQNACDAKYTTRMAIYTLTLNRFHGRLYIGFILDSNAL